MVVRDNPNVHRCSRLRQYAAEHDWLTIVQLPSCAPVPDPVGGIWSLLRRSITVNVVFTDRDGLARTIRRGLRRIQRRAHLIDGCLAETGLSLDTTTQRKGQEHNEVDGCCGPCRVQPLDLSADQIGGRGHVQRREIGDVRQQSPYACVDQRMSSQVRTAVDDAVTNRRRSGHLAEKFRSSAAAAGPGGSEASRSATRSQSAANRAREQSDVKARRASVEDQYVTITALVGAVSTHHTPPVHLRPPARCARHGVRPCAQGQPRCGSGCAPPGSAGQ